jgi:Tol biopolymer transport system component
MTASGTGLRPLSDDLGLDGLPSLSRDGKLLLFTSNRGTSGSTDIWLSNADGTDGANLTNTPTIFDGDPRWLPVP